MPYCQRRTYSRRATSSVIAASLPLPSNAVRIRLPTQSILALISSARLRSSLHLSASSSCQGIASSPASHTISRISTNHTAPSPTLPSTSSPPHSIIPREGQQHRQHSSSLTKHAPATIHRPRPPPPRSPFRLYISNSLSQCLSASLSRSRRSKANQ